MPDDRSPHHRLPGLIHRWAVTKPHHRPSHHLTSVGLALFGFISLIIGLAAIWHPLASLDLGLATNFHRSDLPPLIGIDFLVVPAILLGLAAYRVRWALSLDLEAWKQRRRHRKATPGGSVRGTV
jgi:hypothetical protein